MASGPNKRIPRTKNRFSEVPRAEISRSTFDRSHGVKTTLDAGKVIPIFVDEVLPGDTFTLSMNGFARMATPLHPIMDNLHLDVHWFFVPYRLVWSNWQRFNGEQTNPDDSTDYTMPIVTATPDENDVYDYLGLPIGTPVTAHSLPMRAYNKIWAEFYRDQNLQNQPPQPFDDGPDQASDFQLLPRGKRHDYFTSALPWPQKGDAVEVPLGTVARVHTILGENNAPTVFSDAAGEWRNLSSEGPTVLVSTSLGVEENSLYADLTDATAVTINTLRSAFQVQKMLERDARGGTRYTEIIKAHFGVTSPDARLQRPEYLGGGSTMININPIAQTSSTSDSQGPVDTPQGNLAAVGTAAWSGMGWNKSFTEHGVVLGLASIRADLTYQQGLERMWWRRTRYDFFWPALQHLGEQEIRNGELYMDDDGQNGGIWAYQERYAEYRYKPSRISGTFRSAASESLDTWHLAQDFAGRPALNGSFIEEDPPMERILAVDGEPQFLADMWFNLKCARPMPVYGVPGFIDHF